MLNFPVTNYFWPKIFFFLISLHSKLGVGTLSSKDAKISLPEDISMGQYFCFLTETVLMDSHWPNNRGGSKLWWMVDIAILHKSFKDYSNLAIWYIISNSI